MKTSFILMAESRSDVGKGASRRLRHNDLIPAIVYGAGKPPATISLDHKKFALALQNESFYTRILTLKSGQQEENVVLKDLQRHPYKPRILHVDFQRISATEKITMRIPLHFKGGEIAPGVKQKGGAIAHLLSEIQLRCLPADLPEYIEVDLSRLDLDETVHLSDLQLPKGTEIAGLVRDSANDQPVVSVYMPRAIVEEVVAPVVPAEVETVAEAKAKEAAAEEAKAEGTPAAQPTSKEKATSKEKGK